MISIEITKEVYEEFAKRNKLRFPKNFPFKEFEIKIPLKSMIKKNKIIKQIQETRPDLDPFTAIKYANQILDDQYGTLYFSIEDKHYILELYDNGNDLWYKFSYSKEDQDILGFLPNVLYIQDSYEQSESSRPMSVADELKQLVIGVVEYMNRPVVKKTKKKKTVSEKPRKRKEYRSKREKAIQIRKVIYQINNVDNNNEKREYERHTDSWYVRGHYRYYRNEDGSIKKKVWVPGYWKGDKSEEKNKSYKIDSSSLNN